MEIKHRLATRESLGLIIYLVYLLIMTWRKYCLFKLWNILLCILKPVGHLKIAFEIRGSFLHYKLPYKSTEICYSISKRKNCWVQNHTQNVKWVFQVAVTTSRYRVTTLNFAGFISNLIEKFLGVLPSSRYSKKWFGFNRPNIRHVIFCPYEYIYTRYCLANGHPFTLMIKLNHYPFKVIQILRYVRWRYGYSLDIR